MTKVGRKVGYAERRANPLAIFFNVLEGKAFAWVLLIPSLLLVSLFIFYPLYRGIRLSFSEYQLLKGPESRFNGLENFRILINDPDVIDWYNYTKVLTALYDKDNVNNLRVCHGGDITMWSNCFAPYTYPNGNVYVGLFITVL